MAIPPQRRLLRFTSRQRRLGFQWSQPWLAQYVSGLIRYDFRMAFAEGIVGNWMA